MAFFENFTASIKQKWLQFFQVNREWIVRHMEVESVYTQDGGRRPPSYLILGVINALEPKLAQLMLPFSKLNPDADALIDVLELNFDPDMALGNRVGMPRVSEEFSDDSSEMSGEEEEPDVYGGIMMQSITQVEPDELDDMALNDIPPVVVSYEESVVVMPEPDAFDSMSFAAISDEAASDAADDESVVILGLVDEDAFGNVPLLQEPEDESLAVLNAAEVDAFGDISFDDMDDETILQESDDESLETLTAVEQNELGDVLADVWDDDQTLGNLGEVDEDETLLGENKQSDDDEISRLFPNF